MKLLISVWLLFAFEAMCSPVTLGSLNSEFDSSNLEVSYKSCPPGYSQPFNSNWDKCYKVVYEQNLSQKDASKQCQLDNGNLTSVPNDEVNSYIATLASEVIFAPIVWLGIKCNGTVYSCANEDGTPFNYSNFTPGELSSDRLCVIMATEVNRQEWNLSTCKQTYPFVCETYATAVTADPLGCPPNYHEFEGTCYSIMKDVYMYHDDIAGRCERIPGGSAASISSKEVSDFVVTMPTDCPANYEVAIGLYCPNIEYAGDTSSCEWANGTPFSFNNFKPGDPISTPFNTSCVTMINGTWNNDFSCNWEWSCGLCQVPLPGFFQTTTPGSNSEVFSTSPVFPNYNSNSPKPFVTSTNHPSNLNPNVYNNVAIILLCTYIWQLV